MKSTHDCACRLARQHYNRKRTEPLYIVTPRELTGAVQNAISALLGPDSFQGSFWRLGATELRVRTLQDKPPRGSFSVGLCNEGSRLGPGDTDRAALWRKASK